MRSYGEAITDEIVVCKILRSLSQKFDHVVAAIEESKDLSKLSFDTLMGSLLAHEDRINRAGDKSEERVFQVGYNSGGSWRGSGRVRNGARGRGRGRGRSFVTETRECFNCNRIGHIARDCRMKINQAEFAEQKEEEDEEFLFMTNTETDHRTNSIWFVDSGCSNHMTGQRDLFKNLDETQKRHISLGNNHKIEAEGKGTILIKTQQGKGRLIKDVLYAPKLAHNLLSVGQLLQSGYAVLFDNSSCVVKEKESGETIVQVAMTDNMMFPFEISKEEEFSMVAVTS